jgi:alkaline phosphatase D
MGICMKRRAFLASGVLGFPALLLSRSGLGQAYFSNEDLGVASGDPTASSVIIWTKVPSQYAENQGRVRVDVAYEVSLSPDFQEIALSGTQSTSLEHDFTVKIHVQNLEANTRYYFRFATEEGYRSVVGITRTLPDALSSPEKVRFASVSCQDYTLGYFTVYQALLNDDLDFIVHLGDAIYEKSGAIYQGGPVRTDNIGGGKATTLAHYREKYRLYLTDPYYKEIRRRVPFICMSDDHEVFNNWGGGTLLDSEMERKNSGLRAFHEYMPTSNDARTDSSPYQVHRKFAFGNLVDFIVTDQRQYRTGPCKFTDIPICPGSDTRTMLGPAQKEWLLNSLGNSEARWRVMLSGLVTMPIGLSLPGLDYRALEVFGLPEANFNGVFFNRDAWDGYSEERSEICEFVANNKIKNIIMSSGDIHNYYAGSLLRYESEGEKIATEFVTSSITSNGISDLLGFDINSILSPVLLRINPHLKYCNVTRHGYTRFEVREEGAQVTFVAVDSIKRPTSGAGAIGSFKVLPD